MRPRRALLCLVCLAPATLALLACNFVTRALGGGQVTASPSLTLTLPPSSTATPEAAFTPLPTDTRAPAASRTPGVVRTSRPRATVTPGASATAASALPQCAYLPGISTPAIMPPEVLAAYTPTPYPLPPPPTTTPVDAATTETQLHIYQQLWDAVNTNYIYADFNGQDWDAIGAKYKTLIEQGLTNEAFYEALSIMIAELGDDHSAYESPEQVRLADEEFQGQQQYSGVGIMLDFIPEARRGVIVYTFPGSPAAEAGLRPHDAVLAVDGQPFFNDSGPQTGLIRGPEGTTVTITFQRANAVPFDMTLTRRRIAAAQPVHYCQITGTGLAYLFLPSLDDVTLPDQVRAALEALTAAAPLQGLILDNRQNYGGANTILEAILGYFTSGLQGHLVSRQAQRALTIRPQEIGNSQTVPLLLLVGPSTASYGEVMSGVLQNSGRAQVVGQRSMGNVETLWPFYFDDDSRAWIAHETFQPLNLPNGYWEGRGITPDFAAPARWDLFTEASDPALAVAVQLLTRP